MVLLSLHALLLPGMPLSLAGAKRSVKAGSSLAGAEGSGIFSSVIHWLSGGIHVVLLHARSHVLLIHSFKVAAAAHVVVVLSVEDSIDSVSNTAE